MRARRGQKPCQIADHETDCMHQLGSQDIPVVECHGVVEAHGGKVRTPCQPKSKSPDVAALAGRNAGLGREAPGDGEFAGCIRDQFTACQREQHQALGCVAEREGGVGIEGCGERCGRSRSMGQNLLDRGIPMQQGIR